MDKRKLVLLYLIASLVIALILTALTAHISLSTNHPLNIMGRIITSNVDYTVGFPVPISIRTLPGQMIDEPQTLTIVGSWPVNFIFYWFTSYLNIYYIRKLIAKSKT